MKTNKFFYLSLLLCTLALGFTSCDKEEEDEFDTSDLYGYWQAVSQEMQGYVNGELVEEDYYEDDEEGWGIRFVKDGDFYYWEEDNYGGIETEYGGTYSYKDGKLKVYDVEEDDYSSCTVETLTSKKLVLKLTESWTEDGDEYKYVARSTYKKVDVE